MLVGFDSIQDNIPRSANIIFGYVAGNWPTWHEQWFIDHPAQHKISIAIHADEDAHALDVEPGDEAIGPVVSQWVRRQQARGIYRPIIYCQLSNVMTVVNQLHNDGVARDEVRIWSAHYKGDGNPANAHICNPSCGFGLDFVVDGTQWTKAALGLNLDENLLAPDFLVFKKPDVHQYDRFSKILRHIDGMHISEYGRIKRLDFLLSQTPRDEVNIKHVEHQCMLLFARLWNVTHTGRHGKKLPVDSKAAKDNWELYDRKWRGQQLWHAGRGERKS